MLGADFFTSLLVLRAMTDKLLPVAYLEYEYVRALEMVVHHMRRFEFS